MKRGTQEWKQSMINQLARLQEELDETIKAVNEMDELETLDGLTDIQVVLEGAVFLSDLPVDEAFDMVMDNNDLKHTLDYNEAYETVILMGPDKFHVQESVMIEQGMTNPVIYYSVHRYLDNKVCKLLNHPRVDLAPLLEGEV